MDTFCSEVFLYSKSQANQLTFDTQNECLSMPISGFRNGWDLSSTMDLSSTLNLIKITWGSVLQTMDLHTCTTVACLPPIRGLVTPYVYPIHHSFLGVYLSHILAKWLAWYCKQRIYIMFCQRGLDQAPLAEHNVNSKPLGIANSRLIYIH